LLLALRVTFLLTIIALSTVPYAFSTSAGTPMPLSIIRSSLQPAPNYDEQLGETFTQNFNSLSVNVTAVEQTDSYGYGPAYLLNGLSSAGYWYQVGIAYDWPNLNGGYSAGFGMVYEVYSPNGTSIFPSQGGGLTGFSGPVNAGDTIVLSLNFSEGNVIMYAMDLNTGSSATESYSSEGATQFQGLPSSPSNSNGFFTGIMTEWYHLNPYYGSEKQVTYSEHGLNLTSAWLWIDELSSAQHGTGEIFYSSTSSPIYLTPSLYQFSSNGAVEYASNSAFITGLISMSIASFNASPVVTDANINTRGNFSITVNGGIAPYTYSVYLSNGTVVYSVVSSSPSLTAQVSLGRFKAGTYFYYVTVVDSGNEKVTSDTVTITVNQDPEVTARSSTNVTDAGMPVLLTSRAIFGTPPYTYSWYVDGKIVSQQQNFTYTPAEGTYLAYVIANDSSGYTVRSVPFNISVNGDPEVFLVSSRNITDAGVPVTIVSNVSSGTPPYTYSWYVNGHRLNETAPGILFNSTAPGIYGITSAVKDSAGYKVKSVLIVQVNADPKIEVSVTPSSDSFIYVNNLAVLNANVQGGTPPFIYSWYLNGNLVAVNSTPFNSYNLKLGQNSLQVRVTDSVGYSAMSQQVTVVTQYNYLNIGAIISVVLAVALLSALLARRRSVRFFPAER